MIPSSRPVPIFAFPGFPASFSVRWGCGGRSGRCGGSGRRGGSGRCCGVPRYTGGSTAVGSSASRRLPSSRGSGGIKTVGASDPGTGCSSGRSGAAGSASSSPSRSSQDRSNSGSGTAAGCSGAFRGCSNLPFFLIAIAPICHAAGPQRQSSLAMANCLWVLLLYRISNRFARTPDREILVLRPTAAEFHLFVYFSSSNCSKFSRSFRQFALQAQIWLV